MEKSEFLLWSFFILGGFISGGIMYCELVPKKTVKKRHSGIKPRRKPGGIERVYKLRNTPRNAVPDAGYIKGVLARVLRRKAA